MNDVGIYAVSMSELICQCVYLHRTGLPSFLINGGGWILGVAEFVTGRFLVFEHSLLRFCGALGTSLTPVDLEFHILLMYDIPLTKVQAHLQDAVCSACLSVAVFDQTDSEMDKGSGRIVYLSRLAWTWGSSKLGFVVYLGFLKGPGKSFVYN
ncbi:Uncharacterized protein TCM_000930 [Theobroma cacao]|uniref:Uncharacterized protein n=1 Tax=Theobroma cacao TaxID=3641 RepID=A0A061DHG6_THECC|nr:Uncharacterized protein TCM_000930 [Theobroma cacao]